MLYKDILKELAILLSLAVATAFTVNFLSPKGIALFGDWDISQGVITPKSKDDVVAHELEIQSVLETQQGTGTFIGPISVQISKEERQNKLANICSEFLSIAYSYGFSNQEIRNELKQRQGGEQ